MPLNCTLKSSFRGKFECYVFFTIRKKKITMKHTYRRADSGKEMDNTKFWQCCGGTGML